MSDQEEYIDYSPSPQSAVSYTNISAAPNPNAPRGSPFADRYLTATAADRFPGDPDIPTCSYQLTVDDFTSHPAEVTTTWARRPFTRVDEDVEFRLREPSFPYDGRLAANAASASDPTTGRDPEQARFPHIGTRSGVTFVSTHDDSGVKCWYAQ